MDSTKIAVFGATGFIGSNLCRSLISLGNEVHAFARFNSNIWRLEDVKDSLHIHYYKDVSEGTIPDKMKNLKPDVVVNAVGTVGKNQENPLLQWESNFLSIIYLANAIQFSHVGRLIHLGSSFEYGASSTKYHKLTEALECEPVSDYGLAKLFQTNYCSYLNRKNGIPATVLRIFNVFGEFESKERLIPDVTLKALDGETIELHNPQEERDFIWIREAISATTRIISDYRNNNFDGIFNVGTGTSTKIEDVAKIIVNEAGGKSKIMNFGKDERAENYIPGPVADISKMERVADWRPKYDLSYALKETVKWFKKNRGKYKSIN
ncbi:MAG: NAD(P)-dependent oxidoreductase [Thermoplasmatales archaeon]|nr:NAD(P)-dependent oxidoreductase [Thermoplasmatales archaeon]